MRLGGSLFGDCSDPDRWISTLRKHGYTAAYWPLKDDAGADQVKAYADAAVRAGIVIAEVGTWSNPMSPDEPTRRTAIEKCCKGLALADAIGARCCVNIAGSCGQQWDGPHPDNLTPATFDRIVETVRGIIDEVKPTRTFYTLETMPWMYPDSADSYLQLIRTIDRKAFAVHLDPVNIVCSPQRYYGNAALLRECFAKLGPHIKSCHAKDIILSGKLTVHLDEARPGMGGLDYAVFLNEMSRIDPNTPLMLEHMQAEEDYRAAATHIRTVAKQVGVRIQ